MNLQKLKILGAAFLSLLVLQSCNRSKSETLSERDIKIFPVNIAEVTIDTNINSNYYIGNVEASLTVPLNFSMPGTVEKVYVSEGQFVSKGTVLAEMNNESAKSSLKMTEAMEKQARDAYERLTKVYKEGSLPEIKYIDIETKLQQAESSVEMARKNLEDCVLKAPISAMVGKKNIEPGSNSLLAGSAFTLYKIDEVLIKVPIQENEISKIKKGEVAKILVPALDNQEFNGTIQEIGVVSSPISHTYDIKIKIQNKDNLLKPGMVCNVYLKSNSNNGTISVPSNAVVSQNKKNYVYLVNSNNSVTKQEVSVGAYQGNNIIIRSGLDAGNKIVIAGQQKLFDGASIVVNQ